MNDRVFVIDDDEAMRESLEFLLTTASFEVTTFEGVAAFWQALPDLGFGCILTDIRMPEIDGFELLKRLKATAVALPVVVMTGHGDIPLAVDAMKLGALDFLEKPFEEEKLLLTLRNAIDKGREHLQTQTDKAELASRFASLSMRERQVMEGLVAGFSNKIIAKNHNISPRTVEVYRANVMSKTNTSSISELVRLAIRSGTLKE